MPSKQRICGGLPEERYFVARGGLNVPEETSGGMLRQTPKRVAGVADAVVKQLAAMENFEVQAFCPPAPAGVAPVDMPADVHFRTFIAAFVAVLKHGMHNTPPVCKNKVEGLKLVLEAAESVVQKYLLRHWRELAPNGTQVRNLLIPVINIGQDEAMDYIAREALSV